MRTFSMFSGFSSYPAREWRGLATLVALALLTSLCFGRDEGPDDKYVTIYKVIQKADMLSESGKAEQARTNYLEAHAALTAFQREFPYWNPKLVAHRLNLVAQKLAPPAETPAPATGAGATKGSSAGVQVKLLEPGAEPRKELRLHPSASDKQTMEMTVKMVMENSMGDTASPAIKLPAIKVTYNSTVKEVAANGDVTYEMVMGGIDVVEEAGAAPEMAEALKAAVGGVKDVTGTGTMSSRAIAQGLEFQPPPGANPQARQMLDQMKDLCTQLAEPLPEEAVGVGAKWEVKKVIKSQGMTINQTSTYELTALDGDQVTTKSTVVQEASNQKIQSPAMPGLKVDLTKMSARGTGERLADLTKLLPASGSGDIHTETSMKMGTGDKAQPMSMKMDIKLHFETK